MNMRVVITALLMMMRLEGAYVTACYHHRPGLRNKHSLLSLYVSKKPDITVTELRDGLIELVLKNTTVNNKIPNLEPTTDYQYVIESRACDLVIRVRYNSQQVGCSIQTATAIKEQYCILIHCAPSRANLNKELIPRIAIDCGHGGSDKGAQVGDVREKDICLAVGRRLAALLRKRGINVLLIREDDSTVALDDRTRSAKEWGADLLISLHVNAAVNNKAQGIETHCSTPALFTTLFSKKGGDVWLPEAVGAVAMQIHSALVRHLRSKGYMVVDRKIKHSVSQVLCGVPFKALLIEMGFLTHEGERKKLINAEYQDALAEGVFEGIIRAYPLNTK